VAKVRSITCVQILGKANVNSSAGHQQNACPLGTPTKSGCFQCGEPGHLARDCPLEKSQNAEKCYRCGARECWSAWLGLLLTERMHQAAISHGSAPSLKAPVYAITARERVIMHAIALTLPPDEQSSQVIL